MALPGLRAMKTVDSGKDLHRHHELVAHRAQGFDQRAGGPGLAELFAQANDAQLKVGNVILCQPIDVRRSERYLGIRCVTVTTTTTAGAITAFLTTNPAAYLAYPNAI